MRVERAFHFIYKITTLLVLIFLVDRLLSQGYRALRLEKSFKKFYGRYQDLIEKYQRLSAWICHLDLSLGFA